MKIAVLVKHAVDVRSVRIDAETGEPSFAGKPGLDRPDLHAISDAVDLRESSGGHVAVIGLGPAAMKDDLVSALATGVDEAIHIMTEETGDSLATARALAAVAAEGRYDVIFAGKLSEDYGTGQVGMQVAELLDIPHLSGVLSAGLRDGELTVSYELDGFPDEIAAPTPIMLVLSARDSGPKRHSSLRGMMTARKKTIDQQDPETSGASTLSWSAPMAARRGGDRIVVRDDDPAVAAKKLADWLKEHRLVG